MTGSEIFNTAPYSEVVHIAETVCLVWIFAGFYRAISFWFFVLMEPCMLGAGKYFKIFYSIIGFNSISMMNNFTRFKKTPKMLFHKKTMLKNIFSKKSLACFIPTRMISDKNHYVPRGVECFATLWWGKRTLFPQPISRRIFFVGFAHFFKRVGGMFESEFRHAIYTTNNSLSGQGVF